MDGFGASRFGGRWNSPGVPAIYAGLSYAGCLLEVLAHAGIGALPVTFAYVRLRIPAEIAIEHVAASEVPGWDRPDLAASRTLGDAWLRAGRTVAVTVPSIVASPHERNLVINPAHADFARIEIGPIEPVVWDERLFRRH